MTTTDSKFGITESTTLLTGFTKFREGYGGLGFEGPVPMAAARELIDWVPFETEGVSGSILTPDGVRAIHNPNQKMVVHPRTFAILGTVGSGFAVHPYGETLLDNAALITDGALDVARVGTLKQGAKAFVQYELTENMQAGSKGAEPVEFRPFLNAATAVDGNLSTSYFTGSQIIVCDNTLAMALRESAAADTLVKVRHTRNSRLNVQEAREVMGVVFAVAEEFEAEVNRLTAEFVSDDEWKRFVEAYVPLPEKEGRGLTLAQNKREELNTLWTADERVAPWKNSAWGVQAAVNTWGNHFQTVKGATRDERAVARLISGDIEKTDANALKVLAEVR